MKKTITANISGSVFHIEEDAYNQLNAYLSNIRQKFQGSQDADEIIADIEGRIAELFLERMKSERQVVTTEDVASIVQTMGAPDDYLGDEEQDSSTGRSTRRSSGGRRKLYRDPDDRWLGGVIGGIAAYFDTSVLMLRILFIISIFLGLPIVIYIIAWIIIPKAVTNAEKLEMRGEPVTVENIKKMFDDGVDAVERGAKNFADKASSLGKEVRSGKPGNGVDRFFSFLGETLAYLFKALAKIFGFLFVLAGSLLLAAMIVVLFGKFNFILDGVDLMEGNNLKDVAALVFNDLSQAGWMLGATVIAIIIPGIWLVSAGMTMLAKKGLGKVWNIALFPIWLIAIGVAVFIGLQVGLDHSRDVDHRSEVAIMQPAGEIITISCLPDPHFGESSSPNDPTNVKVEGDRAYFGWVDLDVHPSPDSLYHLITVQEASGRSSKQARIRAKNVEFGVEQTDSLIRISPFFSIPTEDRFRAQELEFILQVPVGKAVILHESTAEIIDDIENVQNMYDPEMTGYTWTMTQNGLSNAVAPEDVPNNLPFIEEDAPEDEMEPGEIDEIEEMEEEIEEEGPVAENQESKPRIPFNMPPLIGHIR